jgi:hypothetical protein
MTENSASASASGYTPAETSKFNPEDSQNEENRYR